MRLDSFKHFKTDMYFGIVKRFLAYHPDDARPNTLYLTFDDGPEPGITEFVLQQLALHKAKATFFCCGHNVAAHHELYERLRAEGHAVGNHTYAHLYGPETKPSQYVADVRKCDELLPAGTVLFRPPWGIINFREMLLLRKKRIVLWDVESGDVRPDYDLNGILADIDAHAARGQGIVLFHCSQEHEHRTRVLLPAILEHCAARGYSYETL